jgi:hypothetical protein
MDESPNSLKLKYNGNQNQNLNYLIFAGHFRNNEYKGKGFDGDERWY